jgi:hypothetical protein
MNLERIHRRLIREGDAVAWLDPAKTFGLRFGFNEARGRSPLRAVDRPFSACSRGRDRPGSIR